VPDDTQAALFELCMYKLRVDSRLAEDICYCLDGLLDQQASTLPPEVFQPVVKVLLDSSETAGEERARVAILRSLAELMARACDECRPCMEPALLRLRLRVEAELAQGRPPSGPALDCMRALIHRLGAGIAGQADALLRLLVSAAERSNGPSGTGGSEEALRAAGTLAAALGTRFEAGFPLLWPALSAALASADEPEACLAGVAALRDVVAALGALLGEHALPVLEAVSSLLQRSEEQLHHCIRAPAVMCLGEVARAMGSATPGLEVILSLLEREATAAAAAPSTEGAPQKAPAAGARRSSRRRTCPSVPTSAAQEVRNDVLDAVLGAYEAVVSGCLRSENLPPALRLALPAMLHFACRHAASQGASTAVKRVAVKLVGALAAHLPADLAAFASKDQETKACITMLTLFGSACPSAAVRQFASALTRLELFRAEAVHF